MTRLLFRGWQNIPEEQRSKGARIAFMLVVSLCFAAGIFLRIYGAWIFRHITDPDCGVVALMARHMAMGKGFPVFFYGQDYMGSLEPALSALFCKLLGNSGFAVCLGPVLPAVLTLGVIFLWAKEVGGKAAGLGALACCLIGPYTFFMFQMAPRGGYMVTVLLSTMIMWQSSHAAQQALNKHPLHPARAFLIGLLAGLGWWTNLLIAAALFASAAVLTICLRGPRPWRTIVIAALAFLIGSSPFWYWNAAHDWATFNMYSSVGGMGFSDGLLHLWKKCQRLLWLWHWPEPLRLSALVLHLLLMFAGFVWGVMRLRRGAGVHLACIALFMLISQVLFVRSSFAAMNTARYLLPLVPVGALLIGLAVSALLRRAGLVPACLLIAILLACQVHVFTELRKTGDRVAIREKANGHLLKFLQTNRIETVYGVFKRYPLNFHLGESVNFTMLQGGCYPPLTRAAELSDRIAVLDAVGRIRDFLRVSGGQGKRSNIRGRKIDHAFNPPQSGWAPLEGFEIIDQDGTDQTGMLSDSDLDTWWRAGTAEESAASLEIRFDAQQTLRALRLVGPTPASYASWLRVDIRRTAAARWETLIEDHPLTPYFWSGPRPYAGGPRFRVEYGFPDVPLHAMRLVNVAPPRVGQPEWKVSEVQLFAPGSQVPEQTASLEGLIQLLKTKQTRRLYSDRWVANRVQDVLGGEIEVVLFPPAFPDDSLPGDARIRLDPDTALLCLRHDAPATRAVLSRHGMRMHESELGPWNLFTFGGDAAWDARWGTTLSPLHWAGFGCLNGHWRVYAHDVLDDAMALMQEQRAPGEAARLLLTAASAYPNIVTASADLLDWLQHEGEAVDGFDAFTQSQADISVGARFPGGIVLEGISLSDRWLKPGEAFEIAYHWRRTEDRPVDNVQVFVHFRDKRIRFQDDHRFLGDLPVQAVKMLRHPELHIERRQLRVPPGIPGGFYDIRIGLFDRTTGKRSRVSSDLPVRRRAAVVESALRVDG